MKKKILVLNGPNLNLLGIREPELYGKGTYADLEKYVAEVAAECGVEAEMRQTNHEGTLVDWIQEARGKVDGIVLNAAAYTHTSVAILDALKGTEARVAEVHLTEPKNREDFRKVSYVGMAAERTFSGKGFKSYAEAIRWFAGGLCLVACLSLGAGTLREGFREPPRAAAPEVWWHWMNGNVTREGIVADLDAMAEVGLGGVTIFDAGCGVPAGSLAFGSPAWFDTLRFAVSEAAKRGLRVTLANCSGYSSAGGPWISPDNSMKTVKWADMTLKGARRFTGALPTIPDTLGFCRDIAVLAYRVPAAERPLMEEKGVAVTREDRDAKTAVFTFRFPQPYAATRWEAVWTRASGWVVKGEATLEAADEAGAWRKVSEERINVVDDIQVELHPRSFAFAETASRLWRLTLRTDAGEAALSGVRLGRGMRIPNIANKALYVCTSAPNRAWEASRTACVRPEGVIDLTGRCREGRLEWDVPEGLWRIVRLAYASNGRTCHPASAKGVGLECDKLAKRGVNAHFDAYLEKVCAALGPELTGRDPGFSGVLVDSWEAGAQNWTEDLPAEFKRRRGYDLRDWLLLFTGVPLVSAAESERVLGDFRETVSEMFAENFSDELARRSHAHGLKLSLEAYGTLPARPEAYMRAADIVMTEFWLNYPDPRKELLRTVTDLVHLNPRDRRLIAAESFTGWPSEARWQQDPFALKGTGDAAYALGVNRIITHRFAHQPWVSPVRVPGMTMGAWGTQYDRTQTWWREQGPWVKYQTRCQYLLQQGAFVDDCREGPTLWTHRRLDDGTEVFYVARTNAATETIEVSLPFAGREPELWDAESGRVAKADGWFVRNGRTHVRIALRPMGSAFVVFPPKPTADAEIASERMPCGEVAVEGPWRVTFEAAYEGAPKPTTFASLGSWTESPDDDIRHFSGSATYTHEITIERPRGTRAILDLGEVKNLATVSVNGKTFATLWRPPFEVDVSEALKAERTQKVRLSVRVTNLWPNRLIGDARLKDDCDWAGTFIRRIPDWVTRGEKSPTGRHTFTTVRLWKAGEKLLPSGLMGPVTIRFAEQPQKQGENNMIDMNEQAFVWGKVSDCERYANLHPRFAKAFAFLKRPDLATLPIGRYKIEEGNVWAMVQQCELTPFGDIQKAEVHRAFIDIQAPLDGPETFGLVNTQGELFQPFDTEKDCGFADRATEPLTLQPGEFAIFFPSFGAHAPCKTLGEKASRKKLVIKIRK